MQHEPQHLIVCFDTFFRVSLLIGYWYQGIIDTLFLVSLILGYLDIGIMVSLILSSGYCCSYLDPGIWVSLVLGYWYLVIIDTWFSVSLIPVLGVIDMWVLVAGYH